MYIALKLKTSGENKLSPCFGKVYAVSTTINNLDTNTLQTNALFSTQFTDENSFLSAFYNHVKNLKLVGGHKNNEPLEWITWNGKKFDIPFIIHRSLIAGIDSATVFEIFPSFKDLMPFFKKNSKTNILELSPVAKIGTESINKLSHFANAYGLKIPDIYKDIIDFSFLNDGNNHIDFDKLDINKALAVINTESEFIYKLGGFAV